MKAWLDGKKINPKDMESEDHNMGMYCCCECKITKNWEEYCTCDWEGWISVYNWPTTRKNKKLPFALPEKEGTYLTRYQNDSGDHYEEEQEYKKRPRESKCKITGVPVWLHWSGDSEEQPYAWTSLNKENVDQNQEK